MLLMGLMLPVTKASNGEEINSRAKILPLHQGVEGETKKSIRGIICNGNWNKFLM
jgi:hypothetical protein